MRFHKRLTLLGLILLACVAVPAFGQDGNGVRIYNEHLRVDMDQQRPADREIGFDAGGWFNFALFYYRDAAAQRTRTLRQYQLRGWASLNFKNTHHAYFRGLLNLDSWADGDNPAGRSNVDFDESVERAWYGLDVARLLWQQNGQRSPYQFRVKVGREFATIGSALVLATPLDMVQFDVGVYDWQFKALLGKTVKDASINIDASDRVQAHQDRCFYGFELSYLGLGQHRPYAYYLSNSDHSSPKWDDPAQKYDYSSRYVGLGSQGSIITNLTYVAEVVGEWGSTYSEGSVHGRDPICAWAADFQLEYQFDVNTHPRIKFEYLYGSGDGDRRASSSATTGGNRAGTKDRAFNAFGFRDTGIAFAPRISNIHIYSLTGRFFPLENLSCQLFKKLEVGTSVYFYNKAKANGPISDTTASPNGGKWLGWEWDVFCNWRLTSDLSWTARYGIFQPGGAYRGDFDSSRHFLYTGLSFTF